MRTFLAILLFSLQSLTTFAQTTLTPTAPGSYEADGELFASLKKIGDDFDSIKWIKELFTAAEIADAINKLQSEQGLRVYPLVDFVGADDEFSLGLIELFFDVRANNRPPAWITTTLTLTPLTSDLYNFRQYRLNMDLAPAPTLGISSDLVARVNGQINTALNKIQTINGEPTGLVTAIANGLKELLESLRNLGGLKPNADLLRHISIAYYPSATQAYDYDAPGAGLPPVAQFDSYEVNGKTIQIPAKALADAGTDPVLVSVRKASTAPAGEVVFRYGNGDAVTISSRADTLWTLSLARPTAGDDEVWAWYLWRDSLDKPRESPLLKLNLGVYGGASQKLVVVPVNEASCPVTKEAIQNVLDDTYGQVAQKWTASIAAKLSVPAWDDNADGKFATNFDNNKPEISFTGDMQAVIKVMKAGGSFDEDTYYLFLIDAPQDRNPAFDGYMPVNSRFGFIFTRETSATTIAKTIAHELGHGAYNLEHTPDPPMGATTNLMDYAPNGLRLHLAQWDNIEDPEWRPLANWGDESEGAGVFPNTALVRKIIEKLRYCYVNSQRYSLTKEESGNNYCSNISLSDGNTYSSVSINNNHEQWTIMPNLCLVNNSNTIINYVPRDEAGIPFSVKAGDFTVRIDDSKNASFVSYMKPDAEKWQNQITALKTEIFNEADRDKSIELMYALPNELFTTLNADYRKKYLKRLSEGSLDEGMLNRINEEKLVIQLISTTQSDQIESIMNYLNSDRLMTDFCNGIDNIGGEDNFTSFTNALFKLYLQKYSTSLTANYILPDDRVFQWMDKGLLDKITYKVDYLSNNQIAFSWKYRQNYYTNPIKVSPFEIVAVNFTTDVNFITIPNDKRVIFMPAFVFAWMVNEDNNVDAKLKSDITIKLAEFVFGYYQVKTITKTTSTLIKTLRYINAARTGTNLILVSDAVRNEINNLTGGPNILTAYDKINDVWELSDFTVNWFNGNIEYFTAFTQAWDKMVESNRGIDVVTKYPEFYKLVNQIKEGLK